MANIDTEHSGNPDAAALQLHREDIEALLHAGLPTHWRVRAYADRDVRRIVDLLAAVEEDGLEEKLRIAGFTLEPFVDEGEPEIEQSCRTCMYYEAHRQYCNLPELKLGVKPTWSCVLWRI